MIFSSVGIKSHFCSDLDATQANFKDRAAQPTAVLACVARKPSISSKVMQPVGKTLNTATPTCNPGDEDASLQTVTSQMQNAVLIHICPGLIFHLVFKSQVKHRPDLPCSDLKLICFFPIFIYPVGEKTYIYSQG